MAGERDGAAGGGPVDILYPATLAELFDLWERHADAAPFAGGLSFMSRGGGSPALPPRILALDRIEELRRVTRTERYLEIGAMTPLSEILGLGKAVPEALSRVLGGVAGPQVRALATLGGSLCCRTGGLDVAAALTVLDARVELRAAGRVRQVPASRIDLAPRELLVRVRVPLDQWNYTLCRRFPPSSLAVFVLRSQKDLLADLRVVHTDGRSLLQDRDSETLLRGKRLPLSREDAAEFAASWRRFLETRRGPAAPDALGKERLARFIETAVMGLAD